MKFKDILIISQKNLMRAKLRTLLTIGAVFIGVFAISLTNGLGSGIRSYVNRQLGNLGAENILIVQARQTFPNPVSQDVVEYDQNRQAGQFNVTFLGADDITKIRNIGGTKSITPQFDFRIEYIARDRNSKKYQASASQYVEGFRLEMAAGRLLTATEQNGITIPVRYVAPLGFSSAQDAIGKTVMLSYKDRSGLAQEREVFIAGVQEQSLVGNVDMTVPVALAEEIYRAQTDGASERYPALFVQLENAMADLEQVKQKFSDAGYDARTLEDQVGTIGTVINTILVVLNVFGAIALLAATFGIVNTLFMAVKERTSEIGLMKALGATRGTIFAIFSAEAASIGFWGSSLGIIASIIVGTIANRVATNTFLKNFVGFDLLAFPVLPFLGILAGGIILALIAGALPSLRASRLDPIQALRYE
ncbi:MAG: FtsX-like permease family protein [Patescibacteria group bacterium]